MVKGPQLKTVEFYTLLTASASFEKIFFFIISSRPGRSVKTDVRQRDTAEVKIPNYLVEHFLVMA